MDIRFLRIVHTAMVLWSQKNSDESYAILGMIPFSINQETAQQNAQDWVARRWAAPSDLGDVVATSRVAGLYVPFWTFDSLEDVDYTVWYKVKSGDRTVTRSKVGAMKTAFDDLLMPASHHITPLIRDGILHMVSQMRSNDVVFGYKNDYAWAQHLMDKLVDDYNALAYVHEKAPIEKGMLTWQVMNLHVYERHFDLVK